MLTIKLAQAKEILVLIQENTDVYDSMAGLTAARDEIDLLVDDLEEAVMIQQELGRLFGADKYPDPTFTVSSNALTSLRVFLGRCADDRINSRRYSVETKPW